MKKVWPISSAIRSANDLEDEKTRPGFGFEAQIFRSRGFRQPLKNPDGP